MGERMFECEVGGVGNRGMAVDGGYGSADDLRSDFLGVRPGWRRTAEKAAHQG